MPIIVRDPRQNYHGWWGTFINVADKTDAKSARGLQSDSTNPESLHVFLKTNWNSHFIAQDTVLDEVQLLGEDPTKTMEKLEEINQKEGLELTGEMLKSIRSDLKGLEGKKVLYYIIKAIDHQRTTSLARVLNLTTEACFNNDHWLSSAGDIGQKDIILGRQLKRLP